MNNTFRIKIKILREQNGLSLNEMTKELGIKKSRIGMWKSNNSIPRIDVLLKICNYFTVTTDYLLKDERK